MAYQSNNGGTFNLGSASSALFTLMGGLYGVDVIATWSSGSITLQKVAGDGSTLVNAMAAFSSNSYATAYLPPGQYQFTRASATNAYAVIAPIKIGGNQ